MATCDYCGKEFEDGDKAICGLDFCCNECMDDICDICGSPISPATSENYIGRCIKCANNEEYEEE